MKFRSFNPNLSSIRFLGWVALVWILCGTPIAWANQEIVKLAQANRWADFQKQLTTDNVNAAFPDGTTSLHWAAFHGNVEAVRLVLNLTDKSDPSTIYSVSPLSLAAERGHHQIVSMLLAAGADVHQVRLGKETPLMLAARNGDPKTIQILLDHGAEVDAREAKGQTALMWAAAAGNTSAVECLIRANASLDIRLSNSGFTAFHFACRQGQTEVAKNIVQAGFDVNDVLQVKRTGGRNPRNQMSGLMLAIESGHFELALELVKLGADPNDQRSGYAPLHAVSWVRKTKVGDNPEGDPPPRITGRYHSLQFVRKIVAAGADVNLRLLRDKKAKVGKAKLNPDGATPFLFAAATADIPLLNLLLELGADPKIPNQDGCNALMAAAGVGVVAVGEEPGTEEEVANTIRMLSKLGIDTNVVDQNGETAMHGAAYRNYPAIVTLLSDLGADPEVWNRKNRHGWTPRSIAMGNRPGSVKPSPATVAAIDNALENLKDESIQDD
ncbi:MAG: ankyrin repeat domain-containing protein [Planctomycetota bacterium]